MIDERQEARLRDVMTGFGRRDALRGGLAWALGGTALAGCATTQPNLSPQDAADVGRVEAYLNGLGAFAARFHQVWPDGGESTGTAFFQSPDRLRLAYDPPTRLVIVAAGGRLVVHNYANDAVTKVGLASNPLGLLLRRPIALSGDVTVTSVQRSAGALQVSLTRTDNKAQGLLTLTFADRPLLLTGIETVDAAGHDIKLHLFDQRHPDALEPSLFDPATA